MILCQINGFYSADFKLCNNNKKEKSDLYEGIPKNYN